MKEERDGEIVREGSVRARVSVLSRVRMCVCVCVCVCVCARACVRACFSESREREMSSDIVCCSSNMSPVPHTLAMCKLVLFEEKQANTVHVLTQQENATPLHSTYCLVPLRLNSFIILSMTARIIKHTKMTLV